jgi:hypothetical protein
VQPRPELKDERARTAYGAESVRDDSLPDT